MSAEDEFRQKWQENHTLKPRIRKVTVNISVGKSGEPLEKAVRILEQLTSQRPVKRKAKKTIKDFGITKDEPISCVVTLRGEKAAEFLNKTLQAVDKKIPKEHFDNNGNFSFGVKEHIEIPGVKYVPALGIFGMDISVNLSRAGYRVKERRRAKSSIGRSHLLKPEEAMVFAKDALDVEIA